MRVTLILLCVCIMVSCAGENRYVRTIKASAPVSYEPAGSVPAELDALMASIRDRAIASKAIAEIEETLYLLIDGKVAYTARIDKGKAGFEKGIEPGSKPTITVGVSKEILGYLHDDLEDGKLSDEEVFRIAYILWKPALKRIHAMEYFSSEGEKTAFHVDNHMQFVLKNPQKFTFHGKPVEIAATVFNVDGYFYYMDGLIGDPDTRYELDMDTALAIYSDMVYKAQKTDPASQEMKKLIERVQANFEKSLAYTRRGD